MHNLPFQFIEYRGIMACFEYLRPSVQQVSRNTAKADILKLYELEKKKIKNVLATSYGTTSLTSDLWTAINSDGYLAITAHFVNRDWILRKYILCLSYMHSPHTGVALADKIYDVLNDWGIVEKLSSLTLDNASANDVCVQYLNENF
ncbi:zinc finger BED domain-containing protein RICESLEEPER 2-like [Canna indica]|uniref:Zinc finger BED domain-containing protein RICESLEEPER 2-like n=1 Tax=Canna indica TaxID=4628 RepID=A0AAQ3QM72_9LILI|nr:zinc finger BED domain-containing protein RICESLEEPER 2-like [Canna indica]